MPRISIRLKQEQFDELIFIKNQNKNTISETIRISIEDSIKKNRRKQKNERNSNISTTEKR